MTNPLRSHYHAGVITAALFGLAAPVIVRAQAVAPKASAISVTMWPLPDADMIAEDLAYDAPRQRFLVSSVRRGGVQAINRQGHVTTFIGADSLSWGTFALGVDAARNTLWVTTASFPGTARYRAADSARTQLLEYDLTTGALRRRRLPPGESAHALGDMTVAPDGTVYLGDGFAGAVYALDPGAAAMRVLVAPRTFRSAQTPALSADGTHLYVPDYANGIAVIDLRSAQWHWLARPDSLGLKGIDGLYLAGNDLVAVQNGRSPNRILRLVLGDVDHIVDVVTLATGSDDVDLNHALPLDGSLYFIARSGWDRMSDDGRYTPAPAGQGPQIRIIRP